MEHVFEISQSLNVWVIDFVLQSLLTGLGVAALPIFGKLILEWIFLKTDHYQRG